MPFLNQVTRTRVTPSGLRPLLDEVTRAHRDVGSRGRLVCYDPGRSPSGVHASMVVR